MNGLLKYRSALLYGIALATLLLLLKWLEWRFMIVNHALEIYIGTIALIFTSLGIWLSLKLVKPKKETVVVEKVIYRETSEFEINQKELDRSGLSKRELEVLNLMARGLSNQEIATHLFVSLNTIKTHSSRVFEKLDVKRRTQAVEKAKSLNLIH